MYVTHTFLYHDNTLRVNRRDSHLCPRVAGRVVETGGDLSHGSIILREIGLPAITNVRGVTRVIQTGDEVVLRAGSGVVERVGVRSGG